jgi:hypothetical protein
VAEDTIGRSQKWLATATAYEPGIPVSLEDPGPSTRERNAQARATGNPESEASK